MGTHPHAFPFRRLAAACDTGRQHHHLRIEAEIKDFAEGKQSIVLLGIFDLPED